MSAPDAEAIQVMALDAGAPWRLYDFDFADFNALTRPPDRGKTLTWSPALAWPDAPPESILKSMGVLTAACQGAGHRAGTRAHRHALSGAGFDGGQMRPDAAPRRRGRHRAGPSPSRIRGLPAHHDRPVAGRRRLVRPPRAVVGRRPGKLSGPTARQRSDWQSSTDCSMATLSVFPGMPLEYMAVRMVRLWTLPCLRRRPGFWPFCCFKA